MDQKPPFSPQEKSTGEKKYRAVRRLPQRSPEKLFTAQKTPPSTQSSNFEDVEELVSAREDPVVGASPEDLVTKTIPVPPGVAPEIFADEQLPVPDESRNLPKNGSETSSVSNVFDWIKTFLFSLAAVILIFNFLLRGVTVDGTSMMPTLENGEYLIISDLFYTPETGDIVVVQSPVYKDASEPLIKRIIAVGGQTVKINFSTWSVTVDGEKLQEDYILRDGHSLMNPEDLPVDDNHETEFTVEDGCVFVMGDNRNDSLDSRSMLVGQIDERYIMGRVLWRVSPFDRFGTVS